MNKDWSKPYESPEEAYVSWYLDELVGGGYVKEYEHQPHSWPLSHNKKYKWIKQLKTKEKYMASTLLQQHVYTPDFEVIWHKEEPGIKSIFYKELPCVGVSKKNPFWARESTLLYDYTRFVVSTWEVKPLFDRNNMTRLFTINQKWVYDKYGVYVQKIIPQKLFKDTFTPARYLLTDSGKQKRKLNFTPRTLEEYVESRKGKITCIEGNKP